MLYYSDRVAHSTEYAYMCSGSGLKIYVNIVRLAYSNLEACGLHPQPDGYSSSEVSVGWCTSFVVNLLVGIG